MLEVQQCHRRGKKNLQLAVDLFYLDERHACQSCDRSVEPGRPRGGFLRLDGTIIDSCPYDLINPETWAMISAYNDWDSGHTPVSLGHAAWVPALYVEGIRLVSR